MKVMKLILRIFFVSFMLLSLVACGKDKPKDITTDNNLLKIGEYDLLYKDACIMADDDGNDAIVITLDFTNNSDDNSSYIWSISETLVQNDEYLDFAIIYTDKDSFKSMSDSQVKEIAPGETIEIKTAFILNDTTSEIEATFEEAFGEKKDTIKIDPSKLSRETSTTTITTTDKIISDETGVETGDELLDWWNGSWYGWWVMDSCSGYYEDMDGIYWDMCGIIDINEDYTGTVTLWDEDYTKSEPMVIASVSLNEAGTGEHGTMMAEGGEFTDVTLKHADWIVDPALTEYENMIHIDGYYENGDDEFHYNIILRPWGIYWNDVDEEALPNFYNEWYLPLIESGKDMPDIIEAGV